MEDAMLNIRTITAGAMLVMMAGAAAAQTDATAAPGKPMSLLQGLLHPAKEKPKAHMKFGHRHTAKSGRHYASRKRHLVAQSDDPVSAASPSPAAAQTTPAAEAVPAAETTTTSFWQAEIATSLPAATPVDDATSDGQPASAQPPSAAMAADASAVKMSSPDKVNAIDLAVGTSHEAAPAVVAPAPRDDGKNSRDAWYEELLAILGGAFVAASVAWLLIGLAPPRRNGRNRMLVYVTERMTR
jgi:hypothetical protein